MYYTNVTITPTRYGDVLEKVLHQYFSKDVISIGAICRKLPFFLADLVMALRTEVKVSCVYEYGHIRTKFQFTDSDGTNVEMVISHKPTSRSGITNARNAIEESFAGDKWCSDPYVLMKLSFTKLGITVKISKVKLSGFGGLFDCVGQYSTSTMGKFNQLFRRKLVESTDWDIQCEYTELEE